jgi:hypothetical protein
MEYALKTEIPLKVIDAVANVASTHPQVLSGISKEMLGVEVGLYPFDWVRQVVSEGLPSDTTLEIDNISRAINGILFAFAYSHQNTPTLLAEVNNILIEKYSAQRDEVYRFISDLSCGENLFASFKSTILAEEAVNLVEDSRIIVDVRPVFSGDDASKIIASIFTRTLRVTCRDSVESPPKVISFSFGSEDLEELKAAIVKAEEKLRCLKENLGDRFGIIVENKNGKRSVS